MPIGRRLFLGGVGAGLVAIVSGGRLVPQLELPNTSGWRIYNVAGRMPSAAGFRLRVDGLVDRPLDLDLGGVLDLPHREQTNDFACVTGWTVDDVRWRGVGLAGLLEDVGVRAGATHVTFHSRDGVYTDSLALGDAMGPDTLLATGMDGDPLPRRHGGPLRLVVPTMYGYKSVKWVGRVEVTDHEVVGYWEQRGYASDARIDTSGAVQAYEGERAAVPGTGYSVELPRRWSLRPLPGGGAVTGPETIAGERVEASIVVVALAEAADRETTQAMLVNVERAGLTNVRYGVIEAGDRTADTLQAEDGSGQRFLFAYLADGKRVVQLHGQAPVSAWTSWAPWFEQLAASIRRT